MPRTGMVLARICGVTVRVRPGALLLVGAITCLLATRLLPAVTPGIGPVAAWLAGLVGAVLFELGVVLHELGHAVFARKAGLRADVAELRLFGGVTDISGEVRSPRDQMRIAGIGPLISFGYGAVIAALTLLTSASAAPPAVVALGVYVAVASAVIGLVNLLPGAPLDGGRLLHAWCWRRSGDAQRGGLTAVRSGAWVAGLLIVAGIVLAATGLLGLIGGGSVAAMGVMAWLGAREERKQLTAGKEAEPTPRDRPVAGSRAGR